MPKSIKVWKQLNTHIVSTQRFPLQQLMVSALQNHKGRSCFENISYKAVPVGNEATDDRVTTAVEGFRKIIPVSWLGWRFISVRFLMPQQMCGWGVKIMA